MDGPCLIEVRDMTGTVIAPELYDADDIECQIGDSRLHDYMRYGT